MTLRSLSRRKVVFLRVRTVNEDNTQYNLWSNALYPWLRYKKCGKGGKNAKFWIG